MHRTSSVTREHVPAYSLFAQLLASERLRVSIDRSATTASFAPVERMLTLPSWSGFSDEAWLLFISHEVGHALFTPATAFSHPQFTALVAQYGQAAVQNVVNVFEDIRIERLVRERYRGLSGVFSRGYHALVGARFFGFASLTPAEWMQRQLLDRVNLYAKVGGLLRLSLDDAREIAWYNAAVQTQTYEDVLTLVATVMAELTEQQRQSAAQPQAGQSAPTDALPSSAAQPSSDASPDAAPSADGSQTPTPDASSAQAQDRSAAAQDAQDSTASSASGAPSEDGPEAPVPPSTASSGQDTPASAQPGPATSPFEIDSQVQAEDTLRRSANRARWNDAAVQHILPANTDYLHLNDVSLHEMLSSWEALPAQRVYLREQVLSQRREQSSILASMIAAFRANQSAWRQRRVQVAKTGSIDPTKLSQYKLTEDLFLRRQSLPEAQHHGFVLHIDWSGSMEGNMTTVLWQVLHLIWFAESIAVPVRVYAFSNAGPDTPAYRDTTIPHWLRERGRLLELYDSTAPAAVKQDAQALLFALVVRFSAALTYVGGQDGYYFRERGSRLPKSLVALGPSLAAYLQSHTSAEVHALFGHPYIGMGGTPLHHALLASVDTVRAFRQRHRIEQCISVWLTDGDDTDGVPVDSGSTEETRSYRASRVHFDPRRTNQHGHSALFDPRSGRRFEVTDGRGLSALFALHRALTGATVICIDITDQPLVSYRRVASRTTLESLASQVGTGLVATGGRRIRARIEKQTRKRVVMRSQQGSFEETGLMLVTSRQYPEIGADAYLVTHHGWWVADDAFSKRAAAKVTDASTSRTWFEAEDDDDADIDETDDGLSLNPVKLNTALLETSGAVAMRRFADLLVPYMAVGRDDATV